MSYSKLFTIKTIIEKEDYHRFLYVSTILKSKVMILFFVFLTAFLSGITSYSENQFYVKDFFIFWIILMIVAISVIIFKIEMIFKQRIKTDKTGVFGSKEILDFYEDFLIVKSEVFEGEMKVRYDQFYKVFESKDYFINYFNANQASMIRKKDMESEVIDSLRALYEKNLTNKYKKVNI